MIYMNLNLKKPFVINNVEILIKKLKKPFIFLEFKMKIF